MPRHTRWETAEQAERVGDMSAECRRIIGFRRASRVEWVKNQDGKFLGKIAIFGRQLGKQKPRFCAKFDAKAGLNFLILKSLMALFLA